LRVPERAAARVIALVAVRVAADSWPSAGPVAAPLRSGTALV
jgi:hypothetical protein